jgi:hypothetical protein
VVAVENVGNEYSNSCSDPTYQWAENNTEGGRDEDLWPESNTEHGQWKRSPQCSYASVESCVNRRCDEAKRSGKGTLVHGEFNEEQLDILALPSLFRLLYRNV